MLLDRRIIPLLVICHAVFAINDVQAQMMATKPSASHNANASSTNGVQDDERASETNPLFGTEASSEELLDGINAGIYRYFGLQAISLDAEFPFSSSADAQTLFVDLDTATNDDFLVTLFF